MAELEDGTVFQSDDDKAQWLDSLPEGVRAWEEAATAKSAESFWDQMGNLRSQVGRSLVIPTEEASSEQLESFYSRAIEKSNGRLTLMPRPDDPPEVQSAYRSAIGVPESVDGYEFPVLDGVPPDLVPEERAKALREIAHTAGIPAKQFTEVAGKLLALDHAAIQASQAQRAAAQETLKTEWGDAYDQRYQRVTAFLERDDAPPELVQAAAAKQLGPDTAKYFYGLVERMGSEAGELARQTGGISVDTPADMEAKITDIMAQDGQNGRTLGPYWDPSHPDHKKTVARVLKMREALNPGDDRMAHSPQVFGTGG